MRLVAIILALGAACAVLEAFAAERTIRLEVRPAAFGFVGSDMEIRIHVERSQDARVLAVAVEGPDFYRSWIDELEPNASPTRRPSWIQAPPAGHYVITAELFDPHYRTRIAREIVETTILAR